MALVGVCAAVSICPFVEMTINNSTSTNVNINHLHTLYQTPAHVYDRQVKKEMKTLARTKITAPQSHPPGVLPRPSSLATGGA
jgi:hypothetical protein